MSDDEASDRMGHEEEEEDQDDSDSDAATSTASAAARAARKKKPAAAKKQLAESPANGRRVAQALGVGATTSRGDRKIRQKPIQIKRKEMQLG